MSYSIQTNYTNSFVCAPIRPLNPACPQPVRKVDQCIHTVGCDIFKLARVRQRQTERCLVFFQVMGNGISATQKVYLLGTNHSVKAHEYPEWVLEKIQNCDLLVSEFDKETIIGDPQANIQQQGATNLFTIFEKLLVFDEEWFKVHLTKLGWSPQGVESGISMLKKKRDEVIRDQKNWQSRLSEETQAQILQYLNCYKLKFRLADIDLLLVESFLDYALGAKDIDLDTNTGEIVILQNFTDRGQPIINLESQDGILLALLEEFLNAISSYSLEGSLKRIQNMLLNIKEESNSKKAYIDWVQQFQI